MADFLSRLLDNNYHDSNPGISPEEVIHLHEGISVPMHIEEDFYSILMHIAIFICGISFIIGILAGFLHLYNLYLGNKIDRRMEKIEEQAIRTARTRLASKNPNYQMPNTSDNNGRFECDFVFSQKKVDPYSHCHRSNYCSDRDGDRTSYKYDNSYIIEMELSKNKRDYDIMPGLKYDQFAEWRSMYLNLDRRFSKYYVRPSCEYCCGSGEKGFGNGNGGGDDNDDNADEQADIDAMAIEMMEMEADMDNGDQN